MADGTDKDIDSDIDNGKLDATEERESALSDLLFEIEAYDLDDEYTEKADELWEAYFGEDGDATLDKINELIYEYEKKAADHIVNNIKERKTNESSSASGTYKSSAPPASSTSSGRGVGKAGCIFPIIFVVGIISIISCMETGHTQIGVAVFAVLFVSFFAFAAIMAFSSRKRFSDKIDSEHYDFTYGTVSKCVQSMSISTGTVNNDAYKVTVQTEDGRTVTAYSRHSIDIGKRIRLAVKKGTTNAQIVDENGEAVFSANNTVSPYNNPVTKSVRDLARKIRPGSAEAMDMEDKLIGEFESRGMHEFIDEYYACVNDIWEEYRGYDDEEDEKVIERIKRMIELFERLYLYKSENEANDDFERDVDDVFPEYADADSDEIMSETTQEEARQNLAASLKLVSDAKAGERESVEPELPKAPTPVEATAPTIIPSKTVTPVEPKEPVKIEHAAPTFAPDSGARKTVSAAPARKSAARKPQIQAESDEAVKSESNTQENAPAPQQADDARSAAKSRRVIGYKSIKKK